MKLKSHIEIDKFRFDGIKMIPTNWDSRSEIV